MEWLATILGSGGLGTVVGMAGSLFRAHIDRKEKANEREFLLKKQELELKEVKLEQTHELEMADKQMERAKVEGEIVIEGKEVDAFAKSLPSEKFTGWLSFVRPAITFFLLFSSTVLAVVVWNKVDGLENFTPEELTDTLRDIIASTLFLTMTAVTWWFGSRPSRTGVRK